MNYLSLLEESYKEVKSNREDFELDRLEFLAEAIFCFTTYENVVAAKMAMRALGVCRAISDRKTVQFISSEEGNLWFLIMVNMPFFTEKIEWGTSTRVWWADNALFDIDSSSLFYRGEQIGVLSLDLPQWKGFIEDMIMFADN